MSGNNWRCVTSVFNTLGIVSKWSMDRLVFYKNDKQVLVCDKGNNYSDDLMQKYLRQVDITMTKYNQIYDTVKNNPA